MGQILSCTKDPPSPRRVSWRAIISDVLFGPINPAIPSSVNPSQNQPKANGPAPSIPGPNAGEPDGAQRWEQVQKLLLGEHKRSVDGRLADVAARLVGESERLSGLLVAMENKHREVEAQLRQEIRACEQREAELGEEIKQLRASHVSRQDLAERFRSMARDVDPGEH